MASSDFAIGMIFLFQTIVGLLGNFFLLYHYTYLELTRYTVRPTDLILRHLTVANSLVLLSKGVPQTMAAFGLKHFLSDIGCKLVFYVHRVGRGVCIGNTCLLSIFQAITISSTNSWWAELKLQTHKFLGPSNVLCWILNLLVSIIIPMRVTHKWINKNNTRKMDLGYCYGVVDHRITHILHNIFLLSYDVSCVGLMIWASGSMVFILYRHQQRVQHIHSTNLSPRSSPESKVTQNILVLVITFVSFYTSSHILILYMVLFHNPSWWLVSTSALITACFPTVSPFVLMIRDRRILRVSSACLRRSAPLHTLFI
ncbi:vomeronasal type-1 receptor 3-like [Urocitellus parryii]|uniref:vomeronasal type-1 receptor 3-like n=1 Tax=Urocitellus parryii TaxID=9999 RepID=UPI000E559441|nr:vomeronasal type-1 receptor 3-like [Urocitellus parryii]